MQIRALKCMQLYMCVSVCFMACCTWTRDFSPSGFSTAQSISICLCAFMATYSVLSDHTSSLSISLVATWPLKCLHIKLCIITFLVVYRYFVARVAVVGADLSPNSPFNYRTTCNQWIVRSVMVVNLAWIAINTHSPAMPYGLSSRKYLKIWYMSM